MRCNTVILDMDGLLSDTELVYYGTPQVVAGRMDFPYSKNLYLKFLGVSDKKVWANYHMIFTEFGKTSVQRFIGDSYQETLERFSQGVMQMRSGVLGLLSFLKEHQVPKVAASSNQRAIIKLLLKKNNLFERFETIISAENVQRAKPDSEIFLLANQKLGTAKKETSILGDSQNGILTASMAKILIITVPDLLPPSQELIGKTARVVSSSHKIPALIK